jgi:hypothetical protein
MMSETQSQISESTAKAEIEREEKSLSPTLATLTAENEELQKKLAEREASVRHLMQVVRYWQLRSPLFYLTHPGYAWRELCNGLRYHLVTRPQRFLWLRYAEFAKGGTARLGELRQHDPKPLGLEIFPGRSADAGELPSVSIVTPSYNQAEFIERTMDSVLGQGYGPLEYIVMDGASKDRTPELLAARAEKVGSAMQWTSERDKGQADAVVKGLARTTGEIMAWLNSDDMFMPGALPFVADYFRRNPDVDVVYGHRVIVDENDGEIGRWILPPYNPESLTFFDFIPQETLFWRRRAWEKVGGLDTTFQFALDWDLLVRFRDAGCNIVRLPYFTGIFRVHTQQKTSSQIGTVGMQEMGRVRERTGADKRPQQAMNRAVLREMFRSRMSHAALALGLRSPGI